MSSKKIEEGYLRFIDSLSKLASSKPVRQAIIVAVVVAVILIVSGLSYGITARQAIAIAVIGGIVRVFFPDMRTQTHAEMFVTSTYYLLGFVGLMLYILAVRRHGSQRSIKYMLVFSTVLILFSAIGILAGFMAKTG